MTVGRPPVRPCALQGQLPSTLYEFQDLPRFVHRVHWQGGQARVLRG